MTNRPRRPATAPRAPIFADQLLSMRMRGKVPAAPIVVSYVGRLELENVQLLAKAGVKYDWRVLKGLNVIIVLGEGDAPSESELIDILVEAATVNIWHHAERKGAWLYVIPEIVGESHVRKAVSTVDFPVGINREWDTRMPEAVAW